MNEILFDALVLFIMVVSAVITYHVVPYLKELVENTRYEKILDTVERAVEAYEQTIKESGQGKVKKAQVLAFVSSWLAEKNIHISEQQLDILIEAAVFAMNKDK